MKKSFLPLGYELQTSEQISTTEKREKLYEYYGIPYGVFDSDKDDDCNSVEKDRTMARILIMRGEEIPKDLEERLLLYKEKDKNK